MPARSSCSFQDVIHVKAFGVLNTKMPDGSARLLAARHHHAPSSRRSSSASASRCSASAGCSASTAPRSTTSCASACATARSTSILFPEGRRRQRAAHHQRPEAHLPAAQRALPDRADGQARLGHADADHASSSGVILEIPRPAFAILGVLRHRRCRPKTSPILNLQVSFLGRRRLRASKELTFDASLFDSRLLTFTLTGDMAVRLYWGDNANFLLTVGGFHPAYTPPPMGLRPLNRLAIVDLRGQPEPARGGLFRRHLEHRAVRRQDRALRRRRRSSTSTASSASTR